MHNLRIELQNQKIVLSLIKAELKTNQLISYLNQSGATVDDFYPDLARVIFELMGFHQNEIKDELFECYDQYIRSAAQLELCEFRDSLNDMAIYIYANIMAKKDCIQ